jgi:hypothetical protein
MSIFDNLDFDNAPQGGDRLYFPAGSFRVKIEVVKQKTAAESFEGKPSFIVETVVLRSSVDSLREGAVVGWVQSLNGKQAKIGASTIKQFFASALGVDDLDAALASGAIKNPDGTPMNATQFGKWATSAANPLRGFELDLVTTVKNLTDGGQFTVHSWRKKGAITFHGDYVSLR